MLVAVRYREIGLGIMRRDGKETHPGGPKEGAETKNFRSLFQDIHVEKEERDAIMLLTDIRDRLQHPIPGPMGYIVRDLISGIAAAVKVTTELWNLPCFPANSGGPHAMTPWRPHMPS
jgi:hypothetical protein